MSAPLPFAAAKIGSDAASSQPLFRWKYKEMRPLAVCRMIPILRH